MTNQKPNFKINRFSTLAKYIGDDWIVDIKEQARKGDPDWFNDIVSELDYLKPGDMFFLKGFHDKLQAAGITSKDINVDKLGQQLLKIENR